MSYGNTFKKEILEGGPAIGGGSIDRGRAVKYYVKNGFTIVPIPPGGKKCIIKGWPEQSPDVLLSCFKPGDGIGIRPAPGTGAADVDTYDVGHANHMHKVFAGFFGTYPYRVGQYPKFLVPIQCPGLTHKITSQRYKDDQGRIYALELLSCKQQYVTCHVHPETGQPYEWHNTEHAPPYPDQPLITVDVIKRIFFREFENYAENVLGLAQYGDSTVKNVREWTALQQTYNHSVQIADVLKQNGYTHIGGNKWGRPDHLDCKQHSGTVNGNTYYNFSSSDLLAGDMTHTPYDIVFWYVFNGDIVAMDKHVNEYVMGTLSGAGFGDDLSELPEGASTESPVDRVMSQLPTEQIIRPEDWFPMVRSAGLTPVDLDSVFTELGKHPLVEGSKQVIKNEYKQRMKEQATADVDAEVESMQKYEIPWVPTSLNDMVHETEKGIMDVGGRLDYFTYGNALSYTADAPPSYYRIADTAPNQVHIKQYTNVTLHSRIEDSCVYTGKTGEGKKFIPVPEKLVNAVRGSAHSAAPVVNGLITHPIVTHSGRIINTEGIDSQVRLMVNYGGTSFSAIKPYTQAEAQAAMIRTRDNMFSESTFRDPVNGWVGAAALVMTTLQRRLMSEAPMIVAKSNTSGSGKTALLEMAHIIATGRRFSPVSLGHEDELEKKVLSMLRLSPTMIPFDNINDGYEINSSFISKLLTGESIGGRILGESRHEIFPTNVMVCASGNNITLSSDLINRTMTIHITADTDAPELKRYNHRRIIDKCLAVRDEVICDLMGVISGYLTSGDNVEVLSRFPDWEDLVAKPVKWATGFDIGRLIHANREESSEYAASEDIVQALYQLYGTGELFTITDVMSLFTNAFGDTDTKNSLKEAIATIAPKALFSIKSMGWVFKKILGKHLNGLMLVGKRTNSARGYKIEEVN